MGHISDEPYARLRKKYLLGGLSKKEFLTQYRKEENYQVEDWFRNQSHVDEIKGTSDDDGF